jgi:hypothetical protein
MRFRRERHVTYGEKRNLYLYGREYNIKMDFKGKGTGRRDMYPSGSA